MAANDPLQIAGAVRNACVLAALDGYERAQIAGLCQEGAWEAAVDAMRMIDLKSILPVAAQPEAARENPPPAAPASA